MTTTFPSGTLGNIILSGIKVPEIKYPLSFPKYLRIGSTKKTLLSWNHKTFDSECSEVAYASILASWIWLKRHFTCWNTLYLSTAPTYWTGRKYMGKTCNSFSKIQIKADKDLQRPRCSNKVGRDWRWPWIFSDAWKLQFWHLKLTLISRDKKISKLI